MTKSTKQSKIMKKSYSLEIVKKSKINIKFKVRESKVFEVSNRQYASNVKVVSKINIDDRLQRGLYYSSKTNSLILIEFVGYSLLSFRSSTFFNDLFTSICKLTALRENLIKLDLIRLDANNIHNFLDKMNNVYSWRTKGTSTELHVRTITNADTNYKGSTALNKSEYEQYFN